MSRSVHALESDEGGVGEGGGGELAAAVEQSSLGEEHIFPGEQQ